MDRPFDSSSKQEFCARFYIPNSIFIQLLDKEALPTVPHNMIYFTKEQFAVSLCLPIQSLLK